MWRPFNNVFSYVYARKVIRKTGQNVLALARQASWEILVQTVPLDWLPEQSDWDTLRPERDVVSWFKETTPTVVQRLVVRGRTMSRIALDRILLVHAMTGNGRKQYINDVYEDYRKVNNVMPLEEKDIDLYSRIFWDVYTPPIADLKLWVRTHLPGEIEERIVDGDATIDQVRVMYGIMHKDDTYERIKRVTQKSLFVVEELCKNLISDDGLRQDVLMAGTQRGVDMLRSSAAFISAVSSFVRLERGELATNDEEADEMLEESVAKRLALIEKAYGESNVQEGDMMRGRTMEDLRQENREILVIPTNGKANNGTK